MESKLHYMRNLQRVVLTSTGQVIFAGPPDQAVVHTTDRPELWSILLKHLVNPVTGGLLAAVGAQPPDLNSELVERLVSTGHLLVAEGSETLLEERRRQLSAAPGFHFEACAASCGHLLVGCSGSVVAGLMAQTLLSFSYSGFQGQMDVILTDTASRFLTRDLLEAYGIRCWGDGFEQQDGIRVPHVALAQSAEIILVLPATANTLNRVAHTACSDLLSLCIAASNAPVVLAPAMNETMWNNPGLQRNLSVLRADGRFVLEPSIIFGAADFGRDAPPMYGGHGSLWAGPLALMEALRSVLDIARSPRCDSGSK